MSDYRVRRLQYRHRELEQSLTEEMGQRRPDSWRIAAIKKEKLAVRDALARCLASNGNSQPQPG